LCSASDLLDEAAVFLPGFIRPNHVLNDSFIGMSEENTAMKLNSESKVNYMKDSAEIPRRCSQIVRTRVYFCSVL